MSSQTLRPAAPPVRRLRPAELLSKPRAMLAATTDGWARVVEAGLVVVLLASLLGARVSLFSWVSDDYTTFLSQWFGYLQAHGFHGLGDSFANYNVPYLYVLWVGTAVHADGLIWVKSVSTASDFALALGCFAVLRQFSVSRRLAFVGAAAALLLPEVLLNSAAWGQADSTYTALIVWALWAALRNRPGTTWVLFALAFTFKLQAAFILPAFVIVHVVRRWGWRGPVLAVATVLATEIPALIAGRSPASLAQIYLDQANGYALLSMNAPTVYAWLPETQHDIIHSAGLYLAMGSVALLSYLLLSSVRRGALTNRTVLLFVAALAGVAPFTLPMMHERYFFVSNVLFFLYALLERRMLPWALAAQVVALMAYSPFLLKVQPVLPMPLLSLIEAAVLFVMVRELLRISAPALESREAAVTVP